MRLRHVLKRDYGKAEPQMADCQSCLLGSKCVRCCSDPSGAQNGSLPQTAMAWFIALDTRSARSLDANWPATPGRPTQNTSRSPRSFRQGLSQWKLKDVTDTSGL